MSVLESEQFTRQLSKRTERDAERLAERFYNENMRFEGEELVQLLQRFMWNEFYFGNYPPAKQLLKIYESNSEDLTEDIDIVLELSNMMRDELKHAKLFANRIEELGRDPDIRNYEPTEGQLEIFHFVFDHDDIASLAACQQGGVERFVPPVFQAIADHDIVDERTQEVLYSADLDKPDHFNVGRKMLLRYATDEETQKRAAEANQRICAKMYEFYGLDYEPTPLDAV